MSGATPSKTSSYFADAAASDYVQIKTPDLGGINNTIEAVIYCREKAWDRAWAAPASETDHPPAFARTLVLPVRRTSCSPSLD